MTGAVLAVDGLARWAPHLVGAYRAALPRAEAVVAHRLAGALLREGLAEVACRGRRHGFGRVEVDAVAGSVAELLPPAAGPLRAELADAVVNLAVALARRSAGFPAAASGDADDVALAAERLAVTGHNLHPCGRTRLGWSMRDVLAHDFEADHTRIGYVAVRDGAWVGDELGVALPDAPRGYRVLPVHVWQRDRVVARRHAGLVADGTLRVLPDETVVAPTAALRTVLLPADGSGSRRYLKVSLDIQVTSTRRGISVASTRNGPVVAGVLRRLVADDPDGHRLLLLDETAGAAVPAGDGRDVSVIVRSGLTGRLGPAERPVPGGALPAVDPATGGPVVAALVAQFARTRSRPDDAAAALAFLTAYAGLLLPPVLRLAMRGVAVEAHLQNCIPTFVGGVPHRLGLRDLAGLRLHGGRLAAAGHRVDLWPGSVIGTEAAPVLLAKVGYTALQAHLGELVVRLVNSHDLDEAAAWRAVRGIVDVTYDALAADRAADRGLRVAAAADHAVLTAPRVAHKALVTMRLRGGGDVYVPVDNPLHG